MERTVYLDNFQTTMVSQEVIDTMNPYFKDVYGYPSSLHSLGMEASEAVEKSVTTVADTINTDPDEIVFTSGATESCNLALFGVANANRKRGDHIIVSKIDHPSVLNACRELESRGFKVDHLDVDEYGLVDLGQLRSLIRKETILVSIIAASHVTSTIEPLMQIGDILRRQDHKIYFHTDAATAFGKMPIDVEKYNLDLLSITAHKIHGPKGVGALYVKKGTNISRIQHGFVSMFNLRPGGENVPGIVGFAKAAEASQNEMDRNWREMERLRNRLAQGIRDSIPDIVFNGPIDESGNPYVLNVSFKYVEGESILLHLDLNGVAVATGSACVSAILEPNYVLTAMGLPPEVAHGSIRFSFSKYNTVEDVDYVLEVLPSIIEKLRSISVVRSKAFKGSLEA